MDFHDRVSSASHLFAAVWCLYTGAVLVRLTWRHPPGHRLSILAYALSAVTLYTFSGLFHGIAHASPETRRVWQLLDQSAIYWLIVGSNVPIAVYLLSPRARNLQLGGMVALAAGGTACLWLLPKAPHDLLVGLYVGLGVVSLIPLRRYYPLVGRGGMVWVFLLTTFYVGGAVIEGVKWPVLLRDASGWIVIGPHELLHLCDIAGTAAHLTLLMRHVLPYGEPLPPPDDGV
jgi:hemolysin III